MFEVLFVWFALCQNCIGIKMSQAVGNEQLNAKNKKRFVTVQ